MPAGFDIVNSLPGILADRKKYSDILPYNSGVRDLPRVIQPLCLMYKRGALPFYRRLPVTAIPFGERQTSGKVAAPVTFFKGSSCILSHLSHPPIVKGALAGRSPLICSRAVIIGPLRSQKDTQHVAEIDSNSLPRERTSNSLATLVKITLLCHEICVGTACRVYCYTLICERW